MDELQQLLAEEEAARLRLAELAEKRRQLEEAKRREEEEERKRAEAEKPITVKVLFLSGGGLTVESAQRDDVLAVWRDTPGRTWKGIDYSSNLGRNFIPISQWTSVEQRLLALPNVTVNWAKGLQDEVHWYLNAPIWEIKIARNQREFECTPGPRCQNQYVLQNIPGAAQDWTAKPFKIDIPTTEGWRLWKALEKTDGVVWSEDARTRIFEQIEKRARLDTIAKKKTSDIVIPTKWEDFHFRGHQLVGTEFIVNAEGRVLLADEMGLGKTAQALGYALIKRAENPDFMTVILCPASLIPNWKREIIKHTGITPVVCQGGKPEFFTLQSVMKRHAFVLASYDTVGLTMEFPKEVDGEVQMHYGPGGELVPVMEEAFTWVNIINAASPDCLICDEAHYVKNPSAKRTKGTLRLTAKDVILMTGTPILNRTEEIWPLLKMLDPVNFKSEEAFLRQYTWNGKTAKNVDELKDLLKPMYLRRTKKDVLADLPPINRIYEWHELSTRAREAYNDVMMGTYEMLKEFDPKGQGGRQSDVMNILAQITRLKQVCAADKVERTADLATEISDSTSNGTVGKVLIFSQFKGIAYEIARRLGREALCFVKRTPDDFVTANVDERDALVQQFRNDPSIRYLVVTEKSAKEGHNIEFAKAVIFNDLFWTPAAHRQGEGRVYGRLSGELRSINAYYLITSSGEDLSTPIEEWIMELLSAKLAIIEETVEGVESARMDENIVMELIERMKQAMWSR